MPLSDIISQCDFVTRILPQDLLTASAVILSSTDISDKDQ